MPLLEIVKHKEVLFEHLVCCIMIQIKGEKLDDSKKMKLLYWDKNLKPYFLLVKLRVSMPINIMIVFFTEWHVWCWQLFSPFRIIKMNLKQVSDNGQRVTILFHARGNNQSLLVLIACKWKLK